MAKLRRNPQSTFPYLQKYQECEDWNAYQKNRYKNTQYFFANEQTNTF